MLAERNIIVHYLQDVARGWRKHAQQVLSDSSQNKPQADEWFRVAKMFEMTADAIQRGNHWR
jgi:hypothetical protein